MDRSSKVTISDVLARSGLHPKILDFAIFNGYRLAHADQSLDEQVACAQRRHNLSREEAMMLLGQEINEDVAEFFNQKFPVVGKNVA
jgi:hypothetical protein